MSEFVSVLSGIVNGTADADDVGSVPLEVLMSAAVAARGTQVTAIATETAADAAQCVAVFLASEQYGGEGAADVAAAIRGKRLSPGAVSRYVTLGRIVARHHVTGAGFAIVRKAYRAVKSHGLSALSLREYGSVDIVAHASRLIGATEAREYRETFAAAERGEAVQTSADRARGVKRSQAEMILRDLNAAADRLAANRDTLTGADVDAIRAALIRLTDGLTTTVALPTVATVAV